MARRPGLDTQRIVQAAAELVDETGQDHLSLGELAQRLGVRTPSLYNHIAGLPAVRRELALLGIRELGSRLGRAAVGKSSDEAVRAIATAYRTFAKDHPGLYAAIQRAPDPADEELREAASEVVDVILAVLEPYGLAGESAIHAVRALRSLMHGFVSLETAGGFGLPLDIDDSYSHLVGMLLSGLHQATSYANAAHEE